VALVDDSSSELIRTFLNVCKGFEGMPFFSVTLNGPSKTFLFSGFGIAGFKLIG